MYSSRNRGARNVVVHPGRSSGFPRHGNHPNIMKGLKRSVVQELSIPDAIPEYRDVEPRRLKPLASYNWTNEKNPTILVPGCPPIWQNRPTPFTVSHDEKSFIDQNRFRVPKYPLLPLISSVNYLHPDFDFASVDIITDRNNLRKLLLAINGVTEGRDFRIDVQLAGASTVLFTRCEDAPVEHDSSNLGYGFNFEACATEPLTGCEKSTGHHRIITYDYGALKLIVRFEVDACLPLDSQALDQNRSAVRTQPATRNDSDDLSTALESLSISADDYVDIIPVGILVPQSYLIEMTSKRQISWRKDFPQLFLSQTPHHYHGIHDSGKFSRIKAQALSDGVLSKQQHAQQESFDKLYALLQKIRKMAIDGGNAARLSLVYRKKTKKLEVFERSSSASSLPDSWMRRFEMRSS